MFMKSAPMHFRLCDLISSVFVIWIFSVCIKMKMKTFGQLNSTDHFRVLTWTGIHKRDQALVEPKSAEVYSCLY